MAIERSHYGMGFGRPFVSDTVSLTIDALFRRA
jgi:polyisoprenoid-binding protein YceI